MIPEGYISGLGRDVPHPRLAHLYEGPFDDPGLPMCRRGWNRGGGKSYSIWRNNEGRNGICKVCMRRAMKGLRGVQPNTEGIPQAYTNRAFQSAYEKGWVACSMQKPISTCPYGDKRGGLYGHVITYSRTFIKAWEHGWWDANKMTE